MRFRIFIAAIFLVLAAGLVLWLRSDAGLARKVAEDWEKISQEIPLKAGESGHWFIDAIRTIGRETALVAFEDGLNGHAAVIRRDGPGYRVEKLYESQMQFSASELDAIQERYGDPGYAPADFAPNGMDRDEGDPFLAKENPAMAVKIAWLNPDGSMPNEAKPGDISGCDHVVLLERQVPRTGGPLAAALRELLADRTNGVPGGALYNYLANGSLYLESVSITAGVADIRLAGVAPPLSGVCDDPRLFIQVAQTARQFPTVQKVRLFVNGTENTGAGDERGL